MSSFNYADLMKQNNQSKGQAKGNGQKIGFFKLSNDGDSAVVRFNVSKIDELKFAKVHTIKDKQGWKTISCFNAIDSFEDKCPLCKANKAGAKDVGKAQNQVFIPVIVSYLDKGTGTYSDPQPAIWQKNAFYGSQEINTKLTQYGDLRESLFTVSRIGGKDPGTKVTYSIDYIPERMAANYNVPADFSAFENYDPAKHDYWVKTEDEIATFLETGEFPAFKKTEKTEAPAAKEEPASQPPFMADEYAASVMPKTAEPEVGGVLAQAEALLAKETPAQPVPTPTADAPQRTFERPAPKFNF